MATPGYTPMTIPPDAYGKNQVNEKPIKAIGVWIGLATNKSMDEELAYTITKGLFDHLDQIHSAAKFLSTVNMENALQQMNVPLHPGAVRYYREQGVKIPDDLIPPEMKKRQAE